MGNVVRWGALLLVGCDTLLGIEDHQLASSADGAGETSVDDASVALCMIAAGTNAFVQLANLDDGGTWIGTGGTVTITSITDTSVTGTFTTQLENTDGTNADAGSLTGTFAAQACP